MIKRRVERRGERLAAGYQSSPSTAAVSVIFLVARVVFYHLFYNLLNVPDFNQDVFGFEIGVNDAALAVKIIEAEQDLFCDLLNKGHRDAPVIPPLDEAQEILAEDFEDHAYVSPVGALVLKRIEEADDVLATGVIGLGLNNTVE